ncbi:hypothetical protein V2S66_13675 [Streptomyces sp. V4-01]|uniref:Uncharacterized protein n=1 Tax=Actinacidiphila polyblastidii TaxID=3110430 RepID=A0ABU7PCK7_9ACTN|nr:hypothetical protein [Streptomyces sp. V4-01]
MPDTTDAPTRPSTTGPSGSGCAVPAPLFPAGPTGPRDLDSCKVLHRAGLRAREGAEQPGGRGDRLSELRENGDRHGVATRLDIVNGAGRSDLAVLPTAPSFLSEQVEGSAGRRPAPASPQR